MNKNSYFDIIKETIEKNPVVLFMKGTPKTPQCGFSGFVCQALNHFNIPFVGVNVLDDPEMRQSIKDFTSWPTIPQLYVRGEFVGGADIIRDLIHKNQFGDLFSNIAEA